MIPLDWFTLAERQVWERRQRGMTNPEIAAELGLKITNVSVLYCNAKKRWNNGGPKSQGWGGQEAVSTRKRIDAKLGGAPCRCGLRGAHDDCLRGDARARRAWE